MLKIRPACSDDASNIGSVHVAVWRTAYSGLIPESVLDAQDVSVRTAFWRAYLVDDNWPVYVAEVHQKIVGFASCIPCRDADLRRGRVCELASIYLLNQNSRNGIGTSLLSRCCNEGVSRGYEAMTLWVLEKNEVACAFYRKQGFKNDGTRTFDENIDAFELRMQKSLPIVT